MTDDQIQKRAEDKYPICPNLVSFEKDEREKEQKAFIVGYKEGLEADRWISVDERWLTATRTMVFSF